MTLIAAFNINQRNPYLISDLLLSGPERRRPVQLPSGDVSTIFPQGAGFVPVGLMQKLVIIADDLIVGWAGSVIYARSLIRELFERRAQSTLSTNDFIRDFLRTLVGSEYDQAGVAFLAYVFDGGRTTLHGFNIKSFRDIQRAELSITGIAMTGSGDTQAYAFLASATERGVLPDPWHFPIMFTGQLFNHELVSNPANRLTEDSNLLRYFGGGYEIASYAEDQYSKLTDHTSLHWVARVVQDPNQIQLHANVGFLIARYEEDVLLLRHGRCENLRIARQAQGFQIVPPIYRGARTGEMARLVDEFGPTAWPVRMEHVPERVAHYVTLFGPDGYVGTVCVPWHQLGRVDFDETRDLTELRVDNAVPQQLMQVAELLYREHLRAHQGE